MSARPSYPLRRNCAFELGELRCAEKRLLEQRIANRDFSDWMRAPKGPDRAWVKPRNDELVPLLKYADHLSLSDDTPITWRERPDFTIGGNPFEVTSTAPLWNASVDHGMEKRIEGELLGRGVSLVGHDFSNARNIRDAVAIGAVSALTRGQRLAACRAGLLRAVQKKGKPTYDTRDVSLLVYCSGFGVQTIDGEFPGLVAEIELTEQRPPFVRILVFHEIVGAPDGILELWPRAQSALRSTDTA